ncbi:MAG: hypothetical protein QXP16_01145 [Candidatus Bathyarchaeia archaeon]
MAASSVSWIVSKPFYEFSPQVAYRTEKIAPNKWHPKYGNDFCV